MHVSIIIRKEQHKHRFHQHHRAHRLQQLQQLSQAPWFYSKIKLLSTVNDGGDDHDEDVELNYSHLIPLFVQQKNARLIDWQPIMMPEFVDIKTEDLHIQSSKPDCGALIYLPISQICLYLSKSMIISQCFVWGNMSTAAALTGLKGSEAGNVFTLRLACPKFVVPLNWPLLLDFSAAAVPSSSGMQSSTALANKLSGLQDI